MTELTRHKLLRTLPTSFESGPHWLRSLRSRAAESLLARGLPTHKTEAWRFTPVRALVEADFERAKLEVPTVRSASQDGITVRSLRSVLESKPGLLEGKLDLAGPPQDFAALNTAMFNDGVWIDVAASAAIDAPIEITHAVDAAGVGYPRVLITRGEGAELTVIDPEQAF